MESQAYFKFFAVIFLLVSGYLVATAFPPTRRRMMNTNGQQLYLVSAVAGIFLSMFPGTIYLLRADWKDKIVDESWFSYLVSDSHALPHISLMTLFLAFFLWAFTFLIDWYWSVNIDNLSKVRWLAKKLEVEKLPYPVKKMLKSLYNRSVWYSYKYIDYSARKLIGNDGQNVLFYDNVASGQHSKKLLMITTNSRKVFICSVFSMPEQNLYDTNGTLGIIPFMSGYLCDKHLQLHVTTDYTEMLEAINSGEIDTDSSMAVYLPVDDIAYSRQFDADIFSQNFKKKPCACGYYVGDTVKVEGG